MKYILPLLLVFIISCSTTPTGRTQLKLMSHSQMASLGDQSYAQLKKKTPISRDPRQNAFVKCITHRLLSTIGENPNAWEVNVFNDNSLNAFALPGKNIGVHTGMVNFVDNQDQLAAVIGHEIGHVLAHHGNERVSQNLILQSGLVATDIYLSKDGRSQKSQMIMAGLGLGAQVGVLLPFSRSHESEADMMGLDYMSRAGFHPQGSVDLWRKMQAKSGGAPPELLSTHPSNSTRIRRLSEAQGRFLPRYNSVINKPGCTK